MPFYLALAVFVKQFCTACTFQNVQKTIGLITQMSGDVVFALLSKK